MLHTLINKILNLNIMEWHPTILFWVYREYDSSYVGIGVLANTKFLLNKSTPYHALNNYLMLLIKCLYIIWYQSKRISEIKNILGDSWARLTVTVWNCPGLDRVRGLMSLHELRPAMNVPNIFFKYCSVKWSSQTILRLKRSTLWPV